MRFKQQGFTLIELLVVIAIIAIMAAIALPNMSQWLAARRVAGQAEQMVNLLRFARSEAVRLNVPVYVCPAQIRENGTPNNYCNFSYLGKGMVAFADSDKSGGYERDKDIDLRTLILNPATVNHVSYTFEACTFGNSCTSDNRIWSFYPNGMFGHVKVNSDNKATGNFEMASGYIKISMTDASAATDQAKQALASVVLIDSGGRASLCAGKDLSDEDKKRCEYKISNAASAE